MGQTRLILVGAAVLLSLGMGIRQSFGLFLTPVTRDLALTAADFTLAVAVQNIVWGLSQAPVGAIADRFGLRATMMAGAAIYVVGLGVMAAIFERPLHPYTRALLASRPSMDPARRIEEPPITGDPPNPIDPPSGCRFHTRCPFAESVCETSDPVSGAWE